MVSLLLLHLLLPLLPEQLLSLLFLLPVLPFQVSEHLLLIQDHTHLLVLKVDSRFDLVKFQLLLKLFNLVSLLLHELRLVDLCLMHYLLMNLYFAP